jgi:outer membrane protein assembly factor BamB
MRTSFVLYGVYAVAVYFLLAMASFSKYAPTNHQSSQELPPAISHVANPAAYVRGTACVASNGIRYAVDGKVVSSYSPSGDKIFDFGDVELLACSLFGDGFLGSHGNDRKRTIRRVSPEGKTLWDIPQPGVFVKAAVSPDGRLFYADTSGLYALSPEGRTLWRHDLFDSAVTKLGVEPWHFLVIGPDSTLFAGAATVEPNFTAKLLAFTPDGQLLWTVSPSPWAFGAPISGANGETYAPSGNNLALIDKSGHVLWKFVPPGNPVYGSGMTPVLGKHGDLYVTAWTLYCVSPEGKERWRFHPDTEQEYFDVPPAVGPDGTLYLASSGPIGRIYAVTPDGKKKWVAMGSHTGYGLRPFRYMADGWMWRTEFQHVTGFPVEQNR